MEQKYLPIGSVCTLKGKSKKVMVTGYYSVEFTGNLKIKDYSGCVYPEGMLLPEQNCIFNHDDIESIDFLGFKNDEYRTFRNLLDRLTGNKVSEEERARKFHEENDMFLTSNSIYSKLLFDENGVVMIADPVIKTKEETKESNITFDENGTVISVHNGQNVKNPFYVDYSETQNVIEQNESLDIFNKYEFDEKGNVTDVKENNTSHLSKIEFDENGVVIAINGDTLKQEQNNKKYNFDENGNVISLEEEIPPIGPGLPGYVKPENKKVSNYNFDEDGNVITEKTYEFDVEGNLVSMSDVEKEEKIPPIGPGLPGYVAPVVAPTAPVEPVAPTGGYQFDANGNVVAAPQAPAQLAQSAEPVFTNIQFDENGTVVSA